MKIEYNYLDTTKYEVLDDVYVTKKLLKKNHIKIKILPLGSVMVGLLFVFFCAWLGYNVAVSRELGLLVVIAFIVGLCFFCGIILMLKDAVCKFKKINRNEFVLASAEFKVSIEDMSAYKYTDEGLNSIGDSYLTYNCMGKQIKIKVSGTAEKRFIDNAKAHFVFLTNNGSIEESPVLLFIGKDYEIEDGIKVI